MWCVLPPAGSGAQSWRSLNGQSSRDRPALGLTSLLNPVESAELPFKSAHGTARVITERGLAETRISDVAEQAGVSPGLILYYFESKDRLLAEALTFANDQFYVRTSREIRRLPSAVDQLRRLIDLSVPGYLPEYERLDEWALWIEVWVRALRDKEMAKDREVLDERWRSQIADIIRNGRSSGEFGSTEDVDELALRLASLIDGLAIQVVMNDSKVTPERMHRACMHVAAHELGFEFANSDVSPDACG